MKKTFLFLKKHKSTAIQLVFIIIVALFVWSLSIGIALSMNVSNDLSRAEKMIEETNYEKATHLLNSVKDRVIVKTLGLKKQDINKKLDEIEELKESKEVFEKAISEIEEGNLEKAETLLLQVSDRSPKYKTAQTRLLELRKRITAEQTAQAVEEATREIRKDISESQAEAERLGRELEEAKRSTPDIPSIIAKWKSIVGRVECGFRYSDTYRLYARTQGSGIAVDFSDPPISIITNRHILVDEGGHSAYSCEVTFSESDYTYSSAAEWEGIRVLTSGHDGGLIHIDNPNNYIRNITESFPERCENRPVEGDKVVILGYPAIGSTEDITATEGIISGFEGKYYITDAKIDQGNSGGAAILVKDNCLLGIPTYAISGSVESLSRILDISVFWK